jgi:hypothetical protein
MTDAQLVAAFESTDLPAEQFTHTNHVRVAWWYLRQSSLPEALLRFSTALRRFAEAKGASGKYHETITVAYMLIIAERLAGERNGSWKQFAAENPDLLVRSPSPLAVFYSSETLTSERARRTFVMPDRVAKALHVRTAVLNEHTQRRTSVSNTSAPLD